MGQGKNTPHNLSHVCCDASSHAASSGDEKNATTQLPPMRQGPSTSVAGRATSPCTPSAGPPTAHPVDADACNDTSTSKVIPLPMPRLSCSSSKQKHRHPSPLTLNVVNHAGRCRAYIPHASILAGKSLVPPQTSSEKKIRLAANNCSLVNSSSPPTSAATQDKQTSQKISTTCPSLTATTCAPADWPFITQLRIRSCNMLQKGAPS